MMLSIHFLFYFDYRCDIVLKGDKMNPLFIERMKKLLKNEYEDFANALSQKQVKALYFNPNKQDLEPLIEKFQLKKHHFVKNGYYFDHEVFPLGKHPYHDCGLYYIQEPSAMMVASLLDIQPNDYVLDMCAAPGGKTCYVASQLMQTGLVIANDINAGRASILSSNVERFGLSNTIVTNTAPGQLTKQLPEYFDKVILDAPCSGEGMFRKLDQAIDTWSLEKVKECAFIQKELIEQAYEALKPGGVLVYSTCTYSKEENEEVVDHLLSLHKDIHLLPIPLQYGMMPGIDHEECCRLYPHKHFGEGHFIALFQKEAKEMKHRTVPCAASTVKKDQMVLLKQFYKDHLKIAVPSYIFDSQQHLYAIQPYFPKLNKVKILRQGLYLGECKKGRFEPSYALSHCLDQSMVKRYYQFDAQSKEIQQYLKGETLEGTGQKGYGVLFVDSYPLAFYKENNGIVKNQFPKGLRKQY